MREYWQPHLTMNRCKEQPLYYEQFVVYASSNEKLMKKKFLIPTILILIIYGCLKKGTASGHRFLILCELRKKGLKTSNLEYEAGSIETLKKMVDMNNGITILPELALKELNARDKKL